MYIEFSSIGTIQESPSFVKSASKKIPMAITFKDVHFSYPSRSEIAVLKGVNLFIPPGKVTAFVRTVIILIESDSYDELRMFFCLL